MVQSLSKQGEKGGKKMDVLKRLKASFVTAIALTLMGPVLCLPGKVFATPGHVGSWRAENRLSIYEQGGNPFVTDYFMDIGIDSQGNVVLVTLSGRVMKYSSHGQLLWEKQFNSTSDFIVHGGSADGSFGCPNTWNYTTTALDIAPDDSILVAGYRGTNVPGTDPPNREFVLRLNSDGTLLWYSDVGPVDWDDHVCDWPYPASYIPLRKDEGPDVHMLPRTNNLLVSSGADFFNGNNGQYALKELSLADGSSVHTWQQGSVLGRFTVTPDGDYIISTTTQAINFWKIHSDIGSYTLNLIRPQDQDSGKYLWIGNSMAAISPDGTLLADTGYAFSSDAGVGHRFYFQSGVPNQQGRYELDPGTVSLWTRGISPDYCSNPDNSHRHPWDHPVNLAVGPDGYAYMVGWLPQYDPGAAVVDHTDCGQYYVKVGYLAAMAPDGHMERELMLGNHKGVEFTTVAVDGGGKVVLAGYKKHFDQNNSWDYDIPIVISDAIGQLPIYRFIKPIVQNKVHDPVDPVTGNYAETDKDLTYPAPIIPLAAIRTYASRFAVEDGPLGHGWGFNLGMRIESTENGLTVLWGDNHGDYFVAGQVYGGKTIYNVFGPDPGYTLTETNTNTEHYFTVYVEKLKRTIRFGHEEGGIFYPTVMFHGQDENATSAYPMTFTYSDGPPKTMVVTEEKSGRAITVTYDENDRIHTLKGPDDATVTYNYDTNGDLVAVTRADGSVVNYVYDDAHHLTEIHHDGKTLLANTYDGSGRVLSQTDALGHVTTFSYDDPAYRVNTITGSDGKKTFYSYDSEYRITKIEDEGGAARTFTYDGYSSRIASTTEPDGATTTFTYDGAGNLIKKTDPSGKSYTYTYNGQGRLVSSVTPGDITAHFTHDAQGRLTDYTLPEGGIYALSYGADGKLTSITDPAGKSETYGHATGLISSTTRRDNVTVSYTRDAAGRVTQKTFDSDHPVTYTYDGLGRVKSIHDDSGTVTYAYDERGRRASRTGPSNEPVTYTYDDAGRLTSMSVGSLTLTTIRDEAGRPVTVSDGFGHNLTYSYDDKGRLGEVSGPANVSISYAYGQDGRVAGITFKKGAIPFRTMTIQRDTSGAVTHISDDGAPPVTGLPQAISLSFNSADRINSATYDHSGRRTTLSQKSYGYDVLGRLTSITSGADSVSISYGPEGKPIEITDSGATFGLVYGGQVPVAEKDASGAISRYFILGNGMSLVLDKNGGIEAVLLSDFRRNFVAAMDASGNLISQRTYSPYGLVLGEEGTWPLPLGFMGEAGIYTLSTGEVLTRSRAYDPETARFLTPDPSAPNPFEPRSLNRYAYAWQDPVNLVDTSGLSPFAPTGPVWLIPCVGGVIGCNVRSTLHPTNTLAGVAGPPMSGPSGIFSFPGTSSMVADSTPIYSDRKAEEGGGNPALAPKFSDASGLVASPIYSDRDFEIPPPVPQNVAVAPGEEYVAGISTVPIIALI